MLAFTALGVLALTLRMGFLRTAVTSAPAVTSVQGRPVSKAVPKPVPVTGTDSAGRQESAKELQRSWVYADQAPSGIFREGQGAVVEGTMGSDGVFHADRVIARHGNRYQRADTVRSGGGSG